MNCPPSEALVPYALGRRDPDAARHVAECPGCRAEVERLQEAAGLLWTPALLERRSETPDCLDEIAIADFVEGRLVLEARAHAVAHLLICGRCRASVRATGHLLADPTVATELGAVARGTRGWRRWWVPVGLAAAATLLVVLRPWDVGREPALRDVPITSSVVPMPLAPRAAVFQVNQLIWSSVPKADLYRVRVYDGVGSVVWKTETADTTAMLPVTVVLSANRAYYWRVEAQAEANRWTASGLVEFHLTGPRR